MRLAFFTPTSLCVARFIFVLICLYSSATAWALDVNMATQSELQQLKGIGPKTAQQIISERERAGPYRSLQDLSDRIKGIGPKRLLSLKEAGLQAEPAVSVQAADKKPKIQIK